MNEHDPEREDSYKFMQNEIKSNKACIPCFLFSPQFLLFTALSTNLMLLYLLLAASLPHCIISILNSSGERLMGRPPCCDKTNVKRGLWTAEEDAKILAYVASHGVGNWTLVPQKAGLNRCGKSCRLRWTNYLRPDLKHEGFTPEEEDYIIELHKAVGSRWSLIAKQLPGRTDNDVKNYWNTKLKKKLVNIGIDPITHKPISRVVNDCHNIINLTTRTASYNKLIRDQQHTMPSSCLLPLTVPSYITDFSSQYYSPMQQPYVPQSPAASSSSSCTVSSTNAAAAQPSTFSWIDHVLQDSLVCFNDDSSLSNMPPVSTSHELDERPSYLLEACSSSSSSFVDSLLDRDLEITTDCPRLLDESFEY